MTQQHPITPPPELVKEWAIANDTVYQDLFVFCENIATQAARWGADQELDACCELTRDNDGYDAALGLRAARRPKPPSLKEQALFAIDTAVADGRLSSDVSNVVRRALESLPE